MKADRWTAMQIRMELEKIYFSLNQEEIEQIGAIVSDGRKRIARELEQCK